VLRELAGILEGRDPDVAHHSERVAEYASAFAIHLNLDPDDVFAVSEAAILHDLGMALVPAQVVTKCGPLTARETAFVHQHPIIVASVCQAIPELAYLAPILRSHHERLDGTGYPDGLRGDAIPVLAQVLGIVDAYDAVLSGRPGQLARTHVEALRELRHDMRRGWRDTRLVAEFIGLVDARQPEHAASQPYANVVNDLLGAGARFTPN
jgi:putative two-component system response regulator